MDDQLANTTFQALANQRNAAFDQAAQLTAQASMLVAENAKLKQDLVDMTASRDALSAEVGRLTPPAQQTA
jgi:cellobiose-specific phosphotransferase system component IIA